MLYIQMHATYPHFNYTKHMRIILITDKKKLKMKWKQDSYEV